MTAFLMMSTQKCSHFLPLPIPVKAPVSYQEDNICLYLLPWREGLYFKCFLIHYLCRDRWLAASVGGLHGVGSYIGDDESSHI